MKPCQLCQNVIARPEPARFIGGWVALEGSTKLVRGLRLRSVCEHCGMKWSGVEEFDYGIGKWSRQGTVHFPGWSAYGEVIAIDEPTGRRDPAHLINRRRQ